MKPRLESSPLTDEDLIIWESVIGGKLWGFRSADCWDFWDTADRRDADLMWALRRWGFIRRTVGGTVFDLDPPRYL